MATIATTSKAWIGGEWVDAIDGAVMDVINPADGSVIAQVPQCSSSDVDRAVDAAKKALPEWLETTPAERSQIMLAMADRLEQNVDSMVEIECANTGKTRLQGVHDMEFSLDLIRYFATAARHLDGISAGNYMRGYESWVRREPIGVVGGIAPWNYPMGMAAWKLSPAIGAGNCQILKPSEQTPLSLLRFAELIEDLLPPGVLNIVTGYGDPVGQRIVEHPDVWMVSLTGSVATGKAIARAASDTLTRVHLELGGKAPVLIFDDADVAEVAQILKVGSYYNSGQDCTAATRLIAGPGVYDELVDAMVETARGVKVGNPAESDDLDIGSVISAEQRDRVLGFVERARGEGAKVLTGGESQGEPGFFVKPTVITDVTQRHEIVQREVFGPVVTIQRSQSDKEMIEWANATRYGLAASVFTRDVHRALDASRRLQFGTVWVNDHWLASGELPHGGFKESGYGKDSSKYGLEDYTQIKNVTMRVGTSFWAAGQAGLTQEGRATV